MSDDTLTERAYDSETGLQMPPRYVWIALGVSLCLSVGIAIFSYDCLKYDYIPKNFDSVVPNLIYRSGQISPAMIEETIRKHRIEVVINLQHYDPNDASQVFEEQVASQMGIDYHRIPMSGNGTGEPEAYSLAIEILDRCATHQQPVLIHCAAGAERTGGVIAAYSLLVGKQSPNEVVKDIRAHRCSFKSDSELRAFLNSNLSTIADRLVKRGVLSARPEGNLEL